jgi:hypothetical protein
VLVELSEGGTDPEPLLAEMARRLSQAHEGLRIPVRQVPQESLPRFELKAKRVKDEREVWGGTGERKAM